MGNSFSKRRKKKPQETETGNPNDTATMTSPTEDILYASINHSSVKAEMPLRDLEDNDCDYAVVKIPDEMTNPTKHKDNEDCSDDYVLMG
ncbi:uncharacterized protein si:ch211-214p13.7 isoform X2 [Myxocyprinus asiaticus]|uniref:uncharacterized protein si:ch211-214p13.7 isoform X2 n=1 Tax=Myxocyprinus asiaticus TaxID=70543 RepID=UPI0022238323|nr:uncharacterized protein si:ch211-214p13.7 isoform X2 [Myxocyprinus asiaticus]